MRPRMACFQAAFLIFGLFAGSAFAEVGLPGLFSDHVVLQRDQPVPVWGIATAGQEVTVSVAGQKKQVKADADGRWQVKLDPMKAGGPHTLVVRGSNALELAETQNRNSHEKRPWTVKAQGRLSQFRNTV